MICAAFIKTYHKNINGIDVFIELVAQYAGDDMWQKLLKGGANILHNQLWSI